MYRRLKNILGVSLMILAIVISQVPMPEAQAEIVREMTDEDLQVDDTSAHVVTFSMNGGTFRGIYNGYSFQEKTPVLVIDDGKSIDSFPDDKLASYAGYKTEPGIWYTDQACLNKYNTDSQVTKSTTLYKKCTILPRMEPPWQTRDFISVPMEQYYIIMTVKIKTS